MTPRDHRRVMTGVDEFIRKHYGGLLRIDTCFFEWVIPTVAGTLHVTIYREVPRGRQAADGLVTIFQKFKMGDLAKEFVGCNPYSGKWNIHLPAGTTWDSTVACFNSQLRPLLMQPTAEKQRERLHTLLSRVPTVYQRVVKDNEEGFYNHFEVSLSTYYSVATGFNLDKFDDEVTKTGGQDMQATVLRLFGEPAVQLLLKVLDDRDHALESLRKRTVNADYSVGRKKSKSRRQTAGAG